MKRTCALALLALTIMLALSACDTSNNPAPSPPPSVTTPTSSSPLFTPTPDAPATQTALVGISKDLESRAIAELPIAVTPTVTPTGGLGIEGVRALQLQSAGQGELWVAYTYGMRLPDQQNHYLAIYRRDDSGWHQLSRYKLEMPDYVDDKSVKQVRVVPGQVWIEVDSGVGAHGGCYDLLRFDGNALNEEVSYCNSAPDVGSLKDLNGDGVPEVVLDESDSYIFCYACGVRLRQFGVFKWNGQHMEEVKLSRLATSTSTAVTAGTPVPGTPAADETASPAATDLASLNNRAVDLANAQLWKDAQDTIDKAQEVDSTNETVAWNAILIHLHSQARAQEAKSDSYPLLGLVFYGDYNAAADLTRQYTAADLFDPNTPLIKGTAAEGWEQELTDRISKSATQALQAEPDLASAYFLRGWALYQATPGSSEAIGDIEKASELAPNDTLFSSSLSYVLNR